MKKIDYMFSNYVRENVLIFNLRNWCEFVKKFTLPIQGDRSPWIINRYPLMVLNLTVS